MELTPVLFLSWGNCVPKKVRTGLDTIPLKESFPRSEEDQLSESPRGRPCEISDDQLETSHHVLLGCLSTYWHEIGWKLSTARTQRNVRNVLAEFFQRHKSFYRFPFDLDSEEPTTSLHPRHLRRQYQKASLDLESLRKEHDQDRQ